MKRPLNLLLAEKTAEELLSKLNTTNLPVNPREIAASRGIAIAEKPLTGCMGCLVKRGDVFGIVYASGLGNDGTVNFTIGHELGHYFLEGHAEELFPAGDGEHRSEGGFVSDKPREREADSFAVGILMPKRLFKAELEQAGSGLPAIRSLADTCRTSLTATAIRFAGFTDEAVAIVVSRGKQVEFCTMSDTLRECGRFEWLRRGDLLPPSSLTARFNQDPCNISCGKTQEGASDLSDWFDGAPAMEMMEDVVGLGRWGRTLTVLFTTESVGPDEWDSADDD